MSKALETESLETTLSANASGSSEWAVDVEIVPRDRYATGDEIAHGGIGRILRANDKRLERQVALKQLLDPTPEYEARFLREALVTAKLQHPAIVPVYDVGRFPDGEIFYAMKLVSGRSLGEVVEETRTFEERLALLPHVIAVAEAIAYAHSEGIVHRDLKPANVLIGPFGETVVIDWGIAKDLHEQEALDRAVQRISGNSFGGDASTSLTMAGAVLGTPGYMPPEQAAGDPVDERADVYALGAILYQVIAGVPPYEGKNGFEVLTRVLTEPPPDLAQRERRVPRDLLAIVQKAMAREPERRYRTAKEFAHDLRRFQTGQIVGAYHYSRRERLYRFVQRHRAAMAATALGLILVGIIGLTSLARVLDARHVAEAERDRANEERARAEQKQGEAEAASHKIMQQSDELLLMEARNAARKDPNAALAWLSSLSNSFQRWGEVRLIAADAQAYGIAKTMRGHTGPVNMIMHSPDGTMLATGSDDRRIGLWTSEGKLIRMLEGHTDEVWRVMYSSDGRRLLSASKDGTIRLWNAKTGDAEHVFRLRGREAMWAGFVDDHRIAAMNCTRHEIELHDMNTDSIESLPGEISCPGSFMLIDHARTIVYSAGGNIRVMDLQTRRYRDYESKLGKCAVVYATENGKYLACSGLGEFVGLWDAKTGKQLEVVPAKASPNYGPNQLTTNGKWFFYADGSTGYIRNLETGLVKTIFDHQSPVFMALFSRDGNRLATTSYDRTTLVTDLVTGSQHRCYGFRDTPSWADFSPTQETVAIGSWDGTSRIFPLVTTRDRIVTQGASAMRTARFSQNENAIVSLEVNGTLHVEALNDKDKPTTKVLEGAKHSLSPNADLVAYDNKAGAIRLHRIGTERPDEQLDGHTDAVLEMQFSEDSGQLLSVSADKTVRLWNLKTRQSRVLFHWNAPITQTRFSPDGSLVAVGDQRGTIHLFQTAGGEERTFTGHVNDVWAFLFMPDGKHLVSGGKDHTLRIWDLADGHARVLDASGLGVHQIIASPDGKILYSLGHESAVRRWTFETGEALPVLVGHRTTVEHIALAPEGSRLVSSGTNGDVRVWDLNSGQSRLLEGHEAQVFHVFFSRQGDTFISAGLDGTVRLWYDDLPFDGGALRAWIEKSSPDKGNATPILD